jgi:hypothetical protein
MSHKCNVCNKQYKTAKTLETHKNKFHNETQPTVEEEEEEEEEEKYEFTEIKSNKVCYYCFTKVNTKDKLLEHMKSCIMRINNVELSTQIFKLDEKVCKLGKMLYNILSILKDVGEISQNEK